MTEPIEPSAEVTELLTLRKTLAELNQKNATRKARIAELETSATTFQTRATEAESRVRQLTIDGPVNDLCQCISVAPEALRTAIETEYKIEMRDGILTLLNRSDDKPVMHDGKQVLMQPEAIKNLLLASKDDSKLRLFRAILIASKASGAGLSSVVPRSTGKAAQLQSFQFGLK